MSPPTNTEILGPVPPAARFLSLRRPPSLSAAELQAALAALPIGDGVLVGIGPQLLRDLGAEVPGLAPFPTFPGEARVPLPHTPVDLLLRIAGSDPGVVVHRARAVQEALPASLLVEDLTDAFMYEGGRDLSGYEDGTENPEGAEAVAAALASGQGPGIDGGSVLAVQRWVHDLAALQAMSKQQQDHAIGRERISNEELEDAPDSAHVKRTAQEDFSPEAFVLRRSMPWSDHRGSGLVFLAFGATAAPFTALLRRMSGAEDGVLDGLFQFTRPVSGAFLWCPPVADGRLDLRALERL